MVSTGERLLLEEKAFKICSHFLFIKFSIKYMDVYFYSLNYGYMIYMYILIIFNEKQPQSNIL